MQVQQRNNNPSFGALIVPKEVIKKLFDNGHLDEFKKALPELKEMAKKNNMEINHEQWHYSATITQKKSFIESLAWVFGRGDFVSGKSFLEARYIDKTVRFKSKALPLEAKEFVKLGKNASDNLAKELEKEKL